MTAQHARRLGKLVAENIVASCGLGGRTRRPYRHHDLASSWTLAGSRPPRIHLGCGFPASPPKRSPADHHLLAMPAIWARIATDWALDAVISRELMQLGLVRSGAVPLTAGTPEHRSLLAAATPQAPNSAS
jgi:NADH:quinone reductase (non-electrogenic)